MPSIGPIRQRALLSDDYRRLNTELHRLDPNYGTTGRRYVGVVRRLAEKYGARQILDYGCGKQDLSNALGSEFDVRSFDPALPGCDAVPEPAELVFCIDVLEHVEIEFLENVLADLARVVVKAGYFSIATSPSGKCLPDGTNCHRIIQDPSWWLARLKRHLRVVTAETPNGERCVQVVVEPHFSRT